jgi:hypothetical protein
MIHYLIAGVLLFMVFILGHRYLEEYQSIGMFRTPIMSGSGGGMDRGDNLRKFTVPISEEASLEEQYYEPQPAPDTENELAKIFEYRRDNMKMPELVYNYDS